jgi:hypothetical protein
MDGDGGGRPARRAERRHPRPRRFGSRSMQSACRNKPSNRRPCARDPGASDGKAKREHRSPQRGGELLTRVAMVRRRYPSALSASQGRRRSRDRMSVSGMSEMGHLRVLRLSIACLGAGVRMAAHRTDADVREHPNPTQERTHGPRVRTGGKQTYTEIEKPLNQLKPAGTLVGTPLRRLSGAFPVDRPDDYLNVACGDPRIGRAPNAGNESDFSLPSNRYLNRHYLPPFGLSSM